MARHVIDLDGEWKVAEGRSDEVPGAFPSTVVVPGLVDMATPGFAEVGLDSNLREAFWYRRSFVLDAAPHDAAVLRIGKARYGTKVFLNGTEVGQHRPNHTPGAFDVAEMLQPGENELLVRLGAWRDPDEAPTEIPDGRDCEAYLAVPGIYDSVQLILTGTPHIEVVKTAPNLADSTVTVIARIRSGAAASETTVRCSVSEAVSGSSRGHAESDVVRLAANEVSEVTVTVPVESVQLWSPEHPFLYSLLVETSGDAQTVRFGMRSFVFDSDSGQALLNGEPYPIRGTSSVVFRLFEDPDRQDRPWRKDWVRKVHRQFKAMHWNTVRYAIGFPPAFWYDIADEEGLLIIDEFPLFYIYTGDNQALVNAAVEDDPSIPSQPIVHLAAPEPSTAPPKAPWPDVLTAESLMGEFTEWVEAHGNHPSVVVWNSNCEGRTPETGKLIKAMREVDPQRRPWGDGWNAPQSDIDAFGAHWYVQWNAAMRGESPGISTLEKSRKSVVGYPLGGTVEEMQVQLRTPRNVFDGVPVNYGNNAVLMEEYGWMWLTRDGTPTRLTKPVYEAMTDWPVATPDERRYTRARVLAAETEFFRCNRTMAGVLLFCGLAGSHPKVFTSDNFVDLESLDFEPHFFRYVRDAFAPVALMVDIWERALGGGMLHEIPVVAINDNGTDWRGRVILRITGPDGPVITQHRSIRLPAGGQLRLFFALTAAIPDGDHQIIAELSDDDGYSVQSVRDITVATPQ